MATRCRRSKVSALILRGPKTRGSHAIQSSYFCNKAQLAVLVSLESGGGAAVEASQHWMRQMTHGGEVVVELVAAWRCWEGGS